MADYKFKYVQVTKADFFNEIISILKSVGWEDISSSAAIDFTVMISTGNARDKKLCLNLRDTNYNNANSISTTNYASFSARLVGSYTEGASGSGGSFERPSEPWTNLIIGGQAWNVGTITPASYLDMYYYADKNGIMMVVCPPESLNIVPSFIMLRQPDEVYDKESGSNGLLMCCSESTTAANVTVCGNPDAYVNSTAAYNLSVYSQLAAKNPNISGIYCMSEIYYGSNNTGIRGKYDGIYALPATNISNKDTLTVDEKVYTAFVMSASGGLPSSVVAVELE